MSKLYSREAEESVLGLFLKDEKAFLESYSILNEADFFIDNNKLIFSSIKQAFNDKKTTNPIIVANYLNSNSKKIKGENYWFKQLTELMILAGLKPALNQYIEEIKEKTQTRKLAKTLKESVEFVNKTQKPIKNLIENIEAKIFNITKERKLKDFSTIFELTNRFNQKVEQMELDGFVDGIKTQIEALDEKLGVLRPGDFVILAARPSMGKTAFALELMKNIARKNKVAMFSLEMPNESLLQRLVTSEAMVNFLSLENKKFFNQSQNKILKLAFDKLKSLNIWIDDTPGLKINEICWKARKLNSLHKLDLIIIDYLQLIEVENSYRESRQQSVSEISRTLKSLARELDIPILALSQLSRKVEMRENKRPQMSDIRESGAIEQDADIILFLYREDYYNHEKTVDIQDLEVIVSKHRNGPTGIIRLKFNKAFGKISSYDEF